MLTFAAGFVRASGTSRKNKRHRGLNDGNSREETAGRKKALVHHGGNGPVMIAERAGSGTKSLGRLLMYLVCALKPASKDEIV